MIDISCHILPNSAYSDDQYKRSISMAKKAMKQGVRSIIATSELTIYDAKEEVLCQVKELNERLEEEGIDIKVLPGAEATFSHSFFRQVKEKKFIPLNKESPYLLINMPSEEISHHYFTETIFELHILGYQVILSNPELHPNFIKNPMELYHLVRSGVLTQISAASIIGKNGWRVQKITEQWIKSQLTHFIASSAQSEEGLWLEKAYSYIKKHYGTDQVFAYMENAEAIIENKRIFAEQPVKPNKRSLFSLF
ncbi:MAG: CpsB/CapC family capsule biosynthesis tyrosine phosphatase [Bacillus sp. (in: firmicutes)]